MIPHESIAPLLSRLGQAATRYQVLTALEAVGPEGARLMHITSGEEFVHPCELVVIQTGREPVAGPSDAALREAGITDVYRIGDCITPRRVSFAVFEAQRIARSI
jgi:hypothetical protein